MKKKTTGLVLLLVSLLSLSPGPAYAFRCGQRLVLVGAATFDVLRKCGEPISINQRVIYWPVSEPSLDSPFEEPLFIPVVIDEWIYNFGPKRFMQNSPLKRASSEGLSRSAMATRGRSSLALWGVLL